MSKSLTVLKDWQSNNKALLREKAFLNFQSFLRILPDEFRDIIKFNNGSNKNFTIKIEEHIFTVDMINNSLLTTVQPFSKNLYKVFYNGSLFWTSDSTIDSFVELLINLLSDNND